MTRLSDWEFDGTCRWFLWGMPLSGKSSVGRKIKNKVIFPVLDLDREIEQRAGKNIPTIFEEEGEKGFRIRESEVLRRIVHDRESFLIVCGGGTPVFFDHADWMNAQGKTIFLDTSVEQLIQRSEMNSEVRPLLANPDREESIRLLAEERRPIFEQAHFLACSEKEILDCFLQWYPRT